MADDTAAALGNRHSFIEDEAMQLPGWIAPVLGLLLILAGLAISHAPFPATRAKVDYSLTEQLVPARASIVAPAGGSLAAATGDDAAR